MFERWLDFANLMWTEPAWRVEPVDVMTRDAILEQRLKVPQHLKDAYFEAQYYLLERTA